MEILQTITELERRISQITQTHEGQLARVGKSNPLVLGQGNFHRTGTGAPTAVATELGFIVLQIDDCVLERSRTQPDTAIGNEDDLAVVLASPVRFEHVVHGHQHILEAGFVIVFDLVQCLPDRFVIPGEIHDHFVQ